MKVCIKYENNYKTIHKDKKYVQELFIYESYLQKLRISVAPVYLIKVPFLHSFSQSRPVPAKAVPVLSRPAATESRSCPVLNLFLIWSPVPVPSRGFPAGTRLVLSRSRPVKGSS